MHIAHSRILSLHGIRFPRVNSHIYNNSLVQLRSSRDFSLVVATRTGKKKKKRRRKKLLTALARRCYILRTRARIRNYASRRCARVFHSHCARETRIARAESLFLLVDNKQNKKEIT